MSRLRWNSYDDRGPTWRRARTRGVAAAVAAAVVGGVACVSGLASVASISRADVPTSDLTVLAQRQAAEQQALDADYAAATAKISQDADGRLVTLKDALARDLAALDASAGAAQTARAAAQQAELAALPTSAAADEAALHARFAADKQTIDAFFTDVLAGLGPDGTTPTKTALDAAKKKLETRRATELSALTASLAAERAAVAAQYDSTLDALDTRLHALDDAHHDGEDALQAATDKAKRALTDSTASIKAQIDTDTVLLKGRHAQERLDLASLHRSQTAAAASSSASVRSALADKQHREDDQLKAQQDNELAAQDYAKKAADSDLAAAVDAADAQGRSDEQALDAAWTADRDAASAQKTAVSQTASTVLRALDDDQSARLAAVKATYDAAVNGIAKGQPGVKAAWSDRLVKHAANEARAVQVLADRSAVKRKQLEDAGTAADKAAARRLDQDKASRQRAYDKDVRQAGWDRKQQLGEAQRDHDRQTRLLASEYFTLKIRAVAFLQDPASFTDVGSAYDPATDPGSLYNVAARIGATDLPSWVTGQGVDVALIDTGVVDAPGLADANVEVGPDFSLEESVPELRGRDTFGHGTHLGGIIAARDAAWNAGDTTRRPDRVLGIAPGARLVSIKTGAADGSVDVTQIIAAINWVIRNKNANGHNIRVINLSFGTDGVQDYKVDPLSYAVERAWKAGIVVVVAGGNDGWKANRLTNPAQDPFVIAVGSSQAGSNTEDVPSAYSEGSTVGRTVDLAAPGRSIVSLRDVGSSADEHNLAGRVGGTLVRGSGTSQAAAVTSGAAALLLQAHPELTPDQVKQVLKATARKPQPGDEALAGAGYIDVGKAVQAKAAYVVQGFQPSDGSGSLDGARGSVRLVRNGIVLEGQYDLFGNDWTGSRWTDDSWSGSTWSGSTWSGSRWTGSRWTSDMWSGSDWAGSRWTSDFWSGSRWTGSRWTADGFTGSRWTGSRWTAGGWFGVGWDDGPETGPVTGQEPVTPEAQAVASSG